MRIIKKTRGLNCMKAFSFILAVMFVISSSVFSADRYWDSAAGSENWLDPVWSVSSGGTYNTNWSTPEDVIIEGTATATITLTGNISTGNIVFTGYHQTIAGGNLNFSGDNIINEYTTTIASRQSTITSGITGSPDVKQATNTKYQGLIFAPATHSMTLGTIQCPSSSGSSDKAGIEFNGAAGILNSVDTIEYYSGRKYGSVDFSGSGNWTVGNVTIGIFDVNSGHVLVNGTVNTQYQHTRLYGGVFHYNNASAVATGKPVYQRGGSYDNTSGSAITSVTNPTQGWYSDHTFIGSQGANSDLHMGTGTVTLYGNYTITIANAATTLTFGGVVTDASNSYRFSKDGPGVLKLEGMNTYNGSTNIISGNLELTQTSLDDDATVYIQSGAKMDLTHASTDTVFALYLGGAAVAAGTWGSTTSSATNKNDTYFSGTGMISNTGGLVNAGFYYWDGPTAGGIGDGASDGGTGTWNTSNSNWDVGVTTRVAWNNSTGGNAHFLGTAGTVTVSGNITIGDIIFNSNGDYILDGGMLNFVSGSNITNVYYNAHTTIKSGITGSPNINMISQPNNSHGFTFDSPYDVILGDVVQSHNQPGASGDKTLLELKGSSNNNSVREVTTETNYTEIDINSTGAWTMGNTRSGWIFITNGNVFITETFHSHQYYIRLDGGILNHNTSAAIRANQYFDFSGGTLDNSSGAAITTSIHNPAIYFNDSLTFAGSQGVNSDLYLGNGAVTMYTNPTVTITNAATTLDFGGAVSESGGARNLTKAGLGTLKLSGDNDYTGTTTINAGNLIVNGNHTSAGAYTVSAYGGFGGNGIISSAVTVSANGELRPGDGVGSLTLGAGLTLDGNSITRFNMDGGICDNVIVTGTLALNGTLDFSGNLRTGLYTIFTCTSGTITNNIHTFSVPNSRYSANITISSNVASANIIAYPSYGTTIRFR